MDPNSTTAVARLHAVQNHLSIQPCFQRHAIHNDKPTGPADLARERANASFKVEDMTEVILRGKENVEALVMIVLLLKEHLFASLSCHEPSTVINYDNGVINVL